MADFAEYGFTSVCGLKVNYASCFAYRCPFRIRSGKACDPNGQNKARNKNNNVVKEKIAIEAFTTVVTVREDPTPDMVEKAILILGKLVKTLRLEKVGKITHHIFRTATGSTSYLGKDAVQVELQQSSLISRPISDQRKHFRKGSIVLTNYDEHGFDFSRVTAQNACALYSANKDSEGLRRFNKPIEIFSTMDAEKAAEVECTAQQFMKREIVKSAFTGGQFGKNDRALWKIDGMGGAGNGTGMGPFVIAYACIVHNPLADVDDRYPNASLWLRTLPVDKLIIKNDVKKGGLHYTDAAIAAATAPSDYRDEVDDNDKEADDDKNRDYETKNYKKQRKI